ncbi:MAG: DUF4405 domain-containing protein [Desulfobacterales bacterium]|nr:DUF4405 domain-containing protein [Deltaproteobacteria bacterium]NNK96065.1 DUF4405 domain-containing protein [Desulfobacterales bacterium]
MNMKKITSMTMLWTLVVLILNSLILYVVPEGRVSYWADWRFLGLTKTHWGEQHTTVGFLFLFAGLLHIYYNWKPILAYMKNKARQVKVFTVPSNIGLALTVIFVVGTYFSIPPMSTIVNISEHFKDAAAQKYGEPPYGHAESSSLKMFTKRESLDFDKSMELLEAAGIKVSGPKATLKEIATDNNSSPQHIYEIIKPASELSLEAVPNTGAVEFPDAPKSGWGNKKLSVVCSEYGLELYDIIKKLADKGISAEADAKIKEIAAENDLEPMGLFEVLHEIVNMTVN